MTEAIERVCPGHQAANAAPINGTTNKTLSIITTRKHYY
jgi:hypothetical protein